MNRKTRAEERIDELDISPAALTAQLEALTAERDEAAREGRRVPRRCSSASAPSSRTSSAAPPRSASATSASRAWT